MTITNKKILEALGLEVGDMQKDDICVALLQIEETLETVAYFLGDGIIHDMGDFEAARLGDASNLVQLIREGL